MVDCGQPITNSLLSNEWIELRFVDTNQNTSDKASALDYELLRSHRIPELPDHIDTVPMERAPAPQSDLEATEYIPPS